MWPREPGPASGRCCRQSASRPGPPRPNQHGPRILRGDSYRRLPAAVSAAGARPIGRLSGVPTERRWVSLARALFLGSSHALTDYSIGRRAIGLDAPRGGGYCPRGAGCTTCGDANPDCRGALLGAIRFGWPSWALRLSSDPRAGCPTVAGRRFPPCPLSLSSHGQLASFENRLHVSKPSSVSPRVLPLDDPSVLPRAPSTPDDSSHLKKSYPPPMRNPLSGQHMGGAQLGGQNDIVFDVSACS